MTKIVATAITRLTLLSPLGLYPSQGVATSYGRLIIEDDIAFIVTNSEHDQRDGDPERFSEVEFLTIEEMRFLGCLTVAWPESLGTLKFYPIPGHMDLPFDLTAPRTALLEAARQHMRAVHADRHATGLVLGPLVGGPAYRRQDEASDEELVESLCGKVDLASHILIRGLGALIRADMLSSRLEFWEPATMMLHISLAATQELTFDMLRHEGNPNPSSKDASERLARAFGDDPRGDNYFQEYYGHRNIIVHPRSRHGTFSYPPLAADDFYDLRPNLIAVYVWLITGSPPCR
jgi:hypothetical protein